MPRVTGPEPVGAAAKRRARLGQFERADDAATVVGMDGRRGFGILLREQLVRRFWPDLVVERLDPLARARGRRRRQVEVGEGGAQVEARSRRRRPG